MHWAYSLTNSARWFWYGFALCVVVPSLVLALLGWRSVRLERRERESQIAHQQAQLAGLSESVLNAAFTRKDQQAVPPTDTFELLSSGEIISKKDRLLIGGDGDFAPALPVDSPNQALIEVAESAEAQGRETEAIAAYQSLRSSPDLADWASLGIARIEMRHEPGALRAWQNKSGKRFAQTFSPEGFPLALIAADLAEQLPSSERARWCGTLREILAQLRAPTWWLSLAQRKAQDEDLRTAMGGSCGGAPGKDIRLERLSETENAIGKGAPLQQDGQSRICRFASGEPCLLLVQPSANAATWSISVYRGDELRAFLSQTLGPVFQPLSYRVALRELSTGKLVWGEFVDPGYSIPLRSLPGWELFVGKPGDTSERLRQASSYALIILLTLVLSFGMSITIRGVGRESEVSRLQSVLAAGVTHEFKSPITSIQLLAERIGRGRVFSEGALNEYCAAIAREAARLEFLVNRLLQTHRIEAGETRYHTAPHRLYEIAKSAIEHFTLQAEARRIQIQLEADSVERETDVDRTAIQDSIQNLVDNAIRYSREESRVQVTIEHRANEVEISVRDEGIGIDGAELARIFGRFYRGKRGLVQCPRGTGLGLWLVKAAVEGHGGRVSVRSVPEQGSEFLLTLPIRGTKRCLES